MIEISCSCGKKINVPDTLAGKKGKCPGCGSIISVPPAAAPPPAKKDDLLLELDDARPAHKPIESLIPPVQELPDDGKPKKKGARIASSDLMGDEPPKHAASRPPRPVGAAGTPDEGKIPCPQCGQMYTADILFCMKCSVDIATGKPISGVLPGKRAKKVDEFDPDLPFWKITLRMFYKPVNTIQYFSAWFERKDVQVQMLAFYVLSFIAVAIAASVRSHRAEAQVVKGPTADELIAKIEAEAGPYEPHIFESWTKSGTAGLEASDAKPFVFRINSPKEKITAGETFNVKFAFCEPGPGKGIEGDAWIMPTASWNGPVQPFSEWVQARVSGQPGDYQADIDAEMAAGSSFAIKLFDKGADPDDPAVTPRSTAHVAWASNPGWAKHVFADLGGTDDQKVESVAEEAAKIEKKKGKLKAPVEWQRAFDARTGRTGQIGEFYWRMELPVAEVEAGQKFTVTLEAALEEDKKPGGPVIADAVAIVHGSGMDEDEGEANKPAKMHEPMAGKWQIEATAVFSKATTVEIRLCPDGQELTPANQLGVISVTFPTKPGWAKTIVEKERKEFEKEHESDKPTTTTGTPMKALIGGAAVIGSILASILGLAVTSGVCTLAARMFGGGGSFLLMFASLAYLTGFANLLELSIFFVPSSLELWASLAISIATGILNFIALMKVFDLDFMSALLATIVARLIVFFLVAWLVIAMLGTAIMVSHH